MKKTINKKIVAIVGTTASGKTNLAVYLAYLFNGEIISADSRQVYRYMDIGTGKDLDEYTVKTKSGPFRIPYHCIDVVGPNTDYNLGKWHKKAVKAADNILSRDKLPIVAGGSGLYAQALIDGYDLPAVKPDFKLRARLERSGNIELFRELEKLDRNFAMGINASDRKNKRRLIRYLEVRKQKKESKKQNHKKKYDSLILGLAWPAEELKERINKRLVQRLENEDMIGEIDRLHNKYHVSWKRLISFGLEYKYVALYLQKKLNYEEMKAEINRASYQFSRRQLSWLRRWERQGVKIHWLSSPKAAGDITRKFIKK